MDRRKIKKKNNNNGYMDAFWRNPGPPGFSIFKKYNMLSLSTFFYNLLTKF